jgi:thiol-disulfide isomerase/thioredoxin
VLPRPSSSGDLPPMPGAKNELPAPAPLARDGSIAPRDNRNVGDSGWSPIPAPSVSPQNDIVLPPPSATTPSGTPVRPDLTTTIPHPDWKPPAANVPTPPTIAPPPLPSDPKSSTSKKQSFVLLDPTGRSVEFPSHRPGELVLLDFMTTSCLPCKRAIPELIEFQRRYGANGVELVGVNCDESSEVDRRTAASAYVRTNGLNYILYTEAKAKAVRKQFNVDRFPTLVLVDSSGSVLWSGHPKEMPELERIVRAALQRQ